MFLLLILLAAPAAKTAEPDDAPVRKALRDCTRSEGPLAFLFNNKPALAIACTQKNKTTLRVFGVSPSNLFVPVCDAKEIGGVAAALSLAKTKKQLLYLVTITHTPEEERVHELAIVPRWGTCEIFAQTDLRHSDEDVVLREPRGGLVFGANGIDIWDDIVRFEFAISLSERRTVTMAMRGKHRAYDAAQAVEVEDKDAVDPVAIASAAIVRAAKAEVLAVANGQLQTQPTLSAGESLELDFATSAVRGVRLRFKQSSGPFVVSINGVETTIGPKMTWQKSQGVFGAGLLRTSEVTQSRDGIVFLQPAIETSKIVIKATQRTQIFEVIPFTDATNWEAFEPSEDFGESKD